MSSNFVVLLLKLFWEFFKTGLFSVGGGMATIPFLADMSAKTHWFSEAQLADMIAVAESTPGPVGVNTATYVGFTTAGIPGAIVATLGLVTPSIIIIICIAYVLSLFRENRIVKYIFYFLRPASIALICSAALTLIYIAFFDQNHEPSIAALNIPACIMALAIFFAIFFIKPLKKMHPLFWIGISAVVGIVLF